MRRVRPSWVTYTSLIYVLSKKGRVMDADRMFVEAMQKSLSPDLVMYNALIDWHCGIANKERAFGLLKEMDRKKVAPDEVTYNTLMRGLSL